MPDIPLLDGQDGARIPAIGLGTYDLRGAAGTAAVTTAIEAGYRLLDSAFNYDNEGAVGRAARDSGVADLIFTTKLPGRYHSHDLARWAVEESLFRSGLDRLGLVLIHWPNPKEDRYAEAWRALVEAREDGLVSMIGVSNFLPDHLDRIIDETGVTPVLNQVEVHPYFPQDGLRAANAERGILTEGWSPLGKNSDDAKDEVVVRIAKAHDVTPRQLLLAWSIQLGVIPLPKSADRDRQAQNLGVFGIELSEDELGEIAGLAGKHVGADPREHQEF